MEVFCYTNVPPRSGFQVASICLPFMTLFVQAICSIGFEQRGNVFFCESMLIMCWFQVSTEV